MDSTSKENRLTPEQVKIVKTHYDELAKLRGFEQADWDGFEEGYFDCLIGSYNLIKKLGEGDPLKAAQVRRKMETGQDWKADLPKAT